MRKLIALLLAALLVFSLTACFGGDSEKNDDKDDEKVEDKENEKDDEDDEKDDEESKDEENKEDEKENEKEDEKENEKEDEKEDEESKDEEETKKPSKDEEPDEELYECEVCGDEVEELVTVEFEGDEYDVCEDCYDEYLEYLEDIYYCDICREETEDPWTFEDEDGFEWYFCDDCYDEYYDEINSGDYFEDDDTDTDVDYGDKDTYTLVMEAAGTYSELEVYADDGIFVGYTQTVTMEAPEEPSDEELEMVYDMFESMFGAGADFFDIYVGYEDGYVEIIVSLSDMDEYDNIVEFVDALGIDIEDVGVDVSEGMPVDALLDNYIEQGYELLD